MHFLHFRRDEDDESLLWKRIGPVAVPRGKRLRAADSPVAGFAERFGGELWKVPEGFVTKDPLTGAERFWASQMHAFEYLKRFTSEMRDRSEVEQSARETPTVQIESQMTGAATKQQPKLRLLRRRDWSLLVVQLVGAATATYLFTNGAPESDDYLGVGRLVVCGLGAYSAYAVAVSRRTGWVWLFGAVAAIYNPFLPVRLRTEGWVTLDLLTAIAFFAFALSIIFFHRQEQAQKNIASDAGRLP